MMTLFISISYEMSGEDLLEESRRAWAFMIRSMLEDQPN